MKHGVEDILMVQWNKLEKLLINLKGNSDSTNENRQLGCVFHVCVLINSERENIKIWATGLSESFMLYNISMRWQTVRGERLTLSKTERFLEQRESITTMMHSLIKSVCEWFHPASKETSNLIAGARHFVSLISLHTEEWSAFLQAAWQFDNGLLPLGNRHRCKARYLVLCFPVAAHIILFEDSHSLQTNETLDLTKAFTFAITSRDADLLN